jgi:hypothetical protein
MRMPARSAEGRTPGTDVELVSAGEKFSFY